MSTPATPLLPAVPRSIGDKMYSGKLMMIALGDIVQPKGWNYRKLDTDNIDALMRSFTDQGQHTPIDLEPYTSDGPTQYGLIAGRHRLEAMRKLDKVYAADGDHRFGHVLAYVFDQSLPEDIRNRLMRVENVTRRNLDDDQLYTDFKKWRDKFPQMPAGRRHKDVPLDNPNCRTNEQAATEFGVSVRMISRWQERMRAETDAAAAEALKAKKETKKAERKIASAAGRQAVQEVRAAKGVGIGNNTGKKKAKPGAAVPTPTVKIVPDAKASTDDLMGGLNAALDGPTPPTHEEQIGSAVRGLLAIILLPEFVETAKLVLAEAPQAKLALLRDALVATSKHLSENPQPQPVTPKVMLAEDRPENPPESEQVPEPAGVIEKSDAVDDLTTQLDNIETGTSNDKEEALLLAD